MGACFRPYNYYGLRLYLTLDFLHTSDLSFTTYLPCWADLENMKSHWNLNLNKLLLTCTLYNARRVMWTMYTSLVLWLLDNFLWFNRLCLLLIDLLVILEIRSSFSHCNCSISSFLSSSWLRITAKSLTASSEHTWDTLIRVYSKLRRTCQGDQVNLKWFLKKIQIWSSVICIRREPLLANG